MPSWRRPSEGRPFGRQQFPPENPFGSAPSSAVPAQTPAEIPPSGATEPPSPWPGERSRLAEILGHRRTPGAGKPPEAPGPTSGGGFGAPPLPSSAPPYPYEGDLDDTYAAPPAPRAAVPPARPDWVPATATTSPAAASASPATAPASPAAPPERSRHALLTDTLAQGLPQVEPATMSDRRPVDNSAVVARPSYDAGGFGRRYEPAPVAFPPATEDVNPYPAAPPAEEPESALVAAMTEPSGALPQRVPAQPDVPRVPEPPSVEPSAEAPALARIATHLRRGDVVPAQERQEGFDVQDILAAVREVGGVRDASLRATPAGAHSLRLDLADGADPAEVSRQVARLLQERMGLDAAMPGDSPVAPFLPGQSRPGRASVPAPVSSAPASAPPAPAAATEAASFPPAPAAPVTAAPVSAPPRASAPVSAPPRSSAPVSAPPRSPAPVSAPPRSPGPVSASPNTFTQASASPNTFTQASASLGSFTQAAALPESRVPAPAEPPVPVPPAGPDPISAAPAGYGSGPASAPTGYGSGLAPAPYGSSPAPVQRTRQVAAPPVEQRTSLVPADASRPRPLDPGDTPGPRVVIENVHVNTFGADASVEVRLRAGGRSASGVATGPAVDGYLLRLCATATAGAVDELLATSQHEHGPARCFVEHAAAVSFGSMQVAVVVLLLSCEGGWVEQLAGSAVVTGDDRHAMVRATLAAVNRRLEALLA
ncbi:Daple [Actinoplanes sp. DH11]|uniref:Daple n=1 Tax=Actinoplanes sp. DH11 TaxID=2857011 RepID=UPI001E30FDDB|nr:Daple [Actinoplanes sp. DH11]